MSSSCSIFLQFFSVWILISIISLYNLMIIERNHHGDGYLQYQLILSTMFIHSLMWCISNCSLIILLYPLLTDDCCKVTSRWLTGQQTLYLYTPRRDLVKIFKTKDQWSPGLSAKFTMLRFRISTSGVLYAPSIGGFPKWCIYSSFGPQHLCVNPSISVFCPFSFV